MLILLAVVVLYVSVIFGPDGQPIDSGAWLSKETCETAVANAKANVPADWTVLDCQEVQVTR